MEEQIAWQVAACAGRVKAGQFGSSMIKHRCRQKGSLTSRIQVKHNKKHFIDYQ